MSRILITGGTVFVSRYVAEYYVKQNHEVYVLNRNHKQQPAGVNLIECDRHNLGDLLRDKQFDIILDITAYTYEDINSLLDALGDYGTYILLSSSAVYPEYAPQPFKENTPLGANKFWGKYGTDKIGAEEALRLRDPKAYMIRPPYLYGPMNQVYREAFVFECALKKRAFYLPDQGQMKLQFFHVEDLCRMMDLLIEKKPKQTIFNAGNIELISVLDWVKLCYQIVGSNPEFVCVDPKIEQRNYFSFYSYEYSLSLENQKMLMTDTIPLEQGLRESYEWYLLHSEEVVRKPLIDYIDSNLKE